ncbi:hypothetical protein ABPG77_006669 [Micractinium sp. CCAP 211/92]
MAARSTRLRAAAGDAGNGGGGCRLAEFLRLLQPGVAREVSLLVYPSLPAAALAKLRALSALLALRLHSYIDAACIDACAGLRHLSKLDLWSPYHPLPELAPLLACANLQMLCLFDKSQRNEPLPLPPPASFRGGRGLRYFWAFTTSTFQVAGARLGHVFLCSTLEPCAEVPASAFLFLHRQQQAADLPRHPLGPLPALLAALLPPGVPLRHLTLLGFRLPRVAACSTQLADVDTLKVLSCVAEGTSGTSSEASSGGCAAWLEPLLQDMPALADLELRRCLAGKLPASLPSLRGLSRLALSDNGLATLPTGCQFWTGLREVDLSRNSFTRLPPALLGASALEGLELSGCRQLTLTAEEAEQLLQALPRLRVVELGGTASEPEVVAQLEHGLAKRRERASA